MTVEERIIVAGRVQVRYIPPYPLSDERKALLGYAASDAVVCERCYCTGRYYSSVGDPICPNCGKLVRSREVICGCVVDRGFHPVKDESVTGRFVPNPNPLHHFRDPAYVWVAPTR